MRPSPLRLLPPRTLSPWSPNRNSLGFKKEETAWYICHRIRAAMHDLEFKQLMGIVEVDESYIGIQRCYLG